MKSTTAVILVLCLVFFFQSCKSRKCYKCKSSVQGRCSKITGTEHLIDCPKHSQCSIQLYSRDNNFTTVRSCEPKGVSHHFKLCDKNKCNYHKEETTTPEEGKPLQCYNCTSSYAYNMKRPNPSCEKIDGTKYLVNCKSGEVCGKYEAQNPDGTVYILDRRCGPGDWKLELQMICYDNKCNSMKMPSVKNKFKYVH